MVNKADQLKKKLEVFMNMMNSPYKMDLSTIIKLFFSMSKMTVVWVAFFDFSYSLIYSNYF
jgi:hypothetical protein